MLEFRSSVTVYQVTVYQVSYHSGNIVMEKIEQYSVDYQNNEILSKQSCVNGIIMKTSFLVPCDAGEAE